MKGVLKMATVKELANMVQLGTFIDSLSAKFHEEFGMNENEFKTKLEKVSYIDKIRDGGKESGIVETSPIGISKEKKEELINKLNNYIKNLDINNKFNECEAPKDVRKKACDDVAKELQKIDSSVTSERLEKELKDITIDSNLTKESSMIKYACIIMPVLIFIAVLTVIYHK